MSIFAMFLQVNKNNYLAKQAIIILKKIAEQNQENYS